jgi:hypothetical protein
VGQGGDLIGRQGRIGFLALALLAPAFAADLADSPRRVLDDERRADQVKRSTAEESRTEPAAPRERPRNAKVCENARLQYHLACGAPHSPRSRTMRCAEADVMYQQSC